MAKTGRLDRLDALRALAMLWMAAYHFAFDLNHFQLMPRQNFYVDPFWTLQRTCILSLFLFCAGAGQALAVARGQDGARFWRRWAQIAGCAALVSLGSMLMFPRSWIYFGVLHGMAVMLILCRPLVRAGAWLWLLGALAVVLPLLVRYPVFDAPPLNVLGLATRKPVTEDWVPLLPWLGVMLWGMAAAQTLAHRAPAALGGPLPGPLRPLATLGRWSLSFYMLHQPVLIGAILVWQVLVRAPVPG